jgi:hypothetical protein
MDKSWIFLYRIEGNKNSQIITALCAESFLFYEKKYSMAAERGALRYKFKTTPIFWFGVLEVFRF